MSPKLCSQTVKCIGFPLGSIRGSSPPPAGPHHLSIDARGLVLEPQNVNEGKTGKMKREKGERREKLSFLLYFFFFIIFFFGSGTQGSDLSACP